MEPQKFTKPFYIFFLMMPAGISQGFVTIALPFLLTKNGFPVALTAGIVAIGLSANLWRFIWGPVVDISLSLHKWFWIAIAASIASLLVNLFYSSNHKGSGIHFTDCLCITSRSYVYGVTC